MNAGTPPYPSHAWAFSPSLVPAEPLPIGETFGAYRVLSTIQRGGMGELFLAETVEPSGVKKKVVLKRLLADLHEDDQHVSMFRSEAKLMSSLDHPNIVKVVDRPMISGKQCLALEYVQGRNVQQILKQCETLGIKMPAQVALQIVCKVLKGLHYAHTFVLKDGRPLGAVHRDVTPANILISFDGQVKITDFGIAKSEMSQVSTTVGVVKGTTRYLTPEQIRGTEVSARTDIISAALVLVEMLTGKSLFDRGTVPPTLLAIVSGERPPMDKLLPINAPRLAEALEKALFVHPSHRHESAEVFMQALLSAASQLGRLVSQEEISAFLKQLFRGSEALSAYENESGSSQQADAMELTYLYEAGDFGAWGYSPSTVQESPFIEEPEEQIPEESAVMSVGTGDIQDSEEDPDTASIPEVSSQELDVAAQALLQEAGICSQDVPPVEASEIEPVEELAPEPEPEPEAEPEAEIVPPAIRNPDKNRWMSLGLQLGLVVFGVMMGSLLLRPESSATEVVAEPAAHSVPVFRAKRFVRRPPPPVVRWRVQGPRGARVWIDGKLQQGRAPMWLKLPPGKYGVRVVRRRYQRAFVLELKEAPAKATSGSR